MKRDDSETRNQKSEVRVASTSSGVLMMESHKTYVSLFQATSSGMYSDFWG